MIFERVYDTSKRVKTFDCIKTLPLMVRKDDEKELDGRPWEWYSVEIEFFDKRFSFNYETGKFYLDFEDVEKSKALKAEHDEAVKDMSDEEKNERLKGKWINYIIRREYILLVWEDNLSDIVKDLIDKFSL